MNGTMGKGRQKNFPPDANGRTINYVVSLRVVEKGSVMGGSGVVEAAVPVDGKTVSLS